MPRAHRDEAHYGRVRDSALKGHVEDAARAIADAGRIVDFSIEQETELRITLPRAVQLVAALLRAQQAIARARALMEQP